MADHDPKPATSELDDSALDGVTGGSGYIMPVKPTFGGPIKPGSGGTTTPPDSTTIDTGPSKPPGTIVFPS